MAVRVNGHEQGDMGEPFRRRQIRRNSAQGFRNGAPYDSRGGNDSPLWPTVNIKIGITDDEIEPDGYGVVTVWRNPINGTEAEKTNEKIRVYLDWMHNDQSIPEDTEVLCVEFPDEKLWRVFIDQDPAAVELERCSDKKTVLAYDIELSEQLGKLSDNKGKVVRLRDSAFFETDCWKIKEKSDCIPEICPDVCLISPDCKTCYGCYKLIQCDDPSVVIITDSNNLCIEHDKSSGGGFPFDVIIEFGAVVILDDGLCYTVEQNDNCINSEAVTVIGVAENCNACNECYRLELCPPDPNFPQSFPNETIYIYKDSHDLSEGDVVKYRGKCYKVYDNGSCPESAFRVTTTLKKYDDCDECYGGCYEFKSCSEGLYDSMIVRSATILDLDNDESDREGYVNVDLDQYIGLVVQTVDGKCFTVSKIYEGCDNAVDVIIVEAYEECDKCGLWRMEGCYGAPDIYTYDDFSQYGDGSGGYVFKRAEDDLCYIQREFNQNPTQIGVPFTVVAKWEDGVCDHCEKPIFRLTPNCDDCDELTGGASDCDSEEGTKIAGGSHEWITDEPLWDYIGQYIKIQGICFYVTEAKDEEITLYSPIVFTGGYPNCDICQKTCLWVVTNVYVSYNEIRQQRKQIIVDQICREDDELIIDIEDCP